MSAEAQHSTEVVQQTTEVAHQSTETAQDSSAGVSMEVWVERVRSVQQSRATPEQLAEVRQRAEQMRRRSECVKRASRISKTQQLSTAAWSKGMRSVSAQECLMIASPMQSAEASHQEMNRTLDLSATAMVRLGGTLTPGATNRNEDELDAELAMMSAQLVENGAIDQADADNADNANNGTEAAQGIDEVLRQVEREPEDDEARAAKFALYESFAKVVEEARAATLGLWSEVKSELGAARVVQQIERELAAIDSERNMGLHFDGPQRVWFVHGMVKTASRNATLLNRTLAGIRTKLELLTQQTECPVCLECFDASPTASDAPRAATTLGCAHKVCNECWQHWCELQGRNAFCPLCRHEEFLQQMLSVRP